MEDGSDLLTETGFRILLEQQPGVPVEVTPTPTPSPAVDADCDDVVYTEEAAESNVIWGEEC